MWCCYRVMGRQAIDLMPEVLHLMLIPLDALAVECDARTAAPDRETVRCTLAVVCWRGLDVAGYASKCDARWLHPMLMHQMHWRSCLIARLLHLMPMSSDARWRLSRCQGLHLTPDGQMHWRSCLLMSGGCTRSRTVRCTGEVVCWCQMAAPDPGRSDALAKLSDCQAAAPDRETARCTLAVVCGESPLQPAGCNVIRDEVPEVLHPMLRPSDALAIFCCACYQAGADKLLTRSKRRLVAFDRFISLTWLQETR